MSSVKLCRNLISSTKPLYHSRHQLAMMFNMMLNIIYSNPGAGKRVVEGRCDREDERVRVRVPAQLSELRGYPTRTSP